MPQIRVSASLCTSISAAITVVFVRTVVFAASAEIPFLSINHMEGHIYAAWLEKSAGPDKEFGLPIV